MPVSDRRLGMRVELMQGFLYILSELLCGSTLYNWVSWCILVSKGSMCLRIVLRECCTVSCLM